MKFNLEKLREIAVPRSREAIEKAEKRKKERNNKNPETLHIMMLCLRTFITGLIISIGFFICYCLSSSVIFLVLSICFLFVGYILFIHEADMYYFKKKLRLERAELLLQMNNNIKSVIEIIDKQQKEIEELKNK